METETMTGSDICLEQLA